MNTSFSNSVTSCSFFSSAPTSGGTLTCSAGGAPQTYTIGSGTIGNGTISGSSVTLDLDTSAWRSTGTVNGNSMSGSVTMHVLVNNTTYSLTGNWVATRQ